MSEGSPSDLVDIPVLALRDTVVFPEATAPLTVGRPASRHLLGSLARIGTYLTGRAFSRGDLVCASFLPDDLILRHVSEDSLVVSPFPTFGEQEHRYADVEEIRRVRSYRYIGGNVVGRVCHQIVEAVCFVQRRFDPAVDELPPAVHRRAAHGLLIHVAEQEGNFFRKFKEEATQIGECIPAKSCGRNF